MKHLKRLAFLAALMVTMIGLGGVANATPANTAASNIAHNRAAALAQADSIAPDGTFIHGN